MGAISVRITSSILGPSGRDTGGLMTRCITYREATAVAAGRRCAMAPPVGRRAPAHAEVGMCRWGGGVTMPRRASAVWALLLVAELATAVEVGAEGGYKDVVVRISDDACSGDKCSHVMDNLKVSFSLSCR